LLYAKKNLADRILKAHPKRFTRDQLLGMNFGALKELEIELAKPAAKKKSKPAPKKEQVKKESKPADVEK